MSTLVAIALLLGVLAYAVFGGADFGAGFWDLTAGGAERGRVPAPRSTTRSARSGRSTTPG
jgi:cytochrome d ubiquinol oxidase subunit II